MRQHWYLLIFALLLSARLGFAQGERKPEIFVGYSNLQAEGLPDRNNPNNFFSNSFFSNRATLHGGTVAGTVFPFGSYAITGDFSFNRQSRSADFSGGKNSEKTNI